MADVAIHPKMTLVRKATDSAPPLVAIKNLVKTYHSARGPITALSDIDLDIANGQFVSIVGPSGCGKSTLLKCIAGLERISSGGITVAGKTVSAPPDDLGIVFQRDVLLDWRTAIDNVLITAEFQKIARATMIERARRLLDSFGLGDFENRYPWELSGGMRQRVAICRALLCDPKFLLMDEPFGALDALTRDELNMQLQELWTRDRKTIVFITHGIDEAVFLSDRVIVMDRNPGRIILDLAIDLPRPRSFAVRDTSAFTHFTAIVRQTMVDAGILRGK